MAAITIDDIGKMYQLPQAGQYHATFRDAIVDAFKSPLRRFRELRGTEASMESFWALRHVSFDVQEGEVVGIVGRNGAGKSTLLKILSRIVDPTEGHAMLRGRVASLLEVGTGFHPELSGRENIYLNGSILGMKKREIDLRFSDIVEFAEIERFLDTPVKRYSSGMYVRLAFAVAAHLEPEILVVDEVLAVGDAEFQKRCLGRIKEVSRADGRTVLFVSHNMTAVQSLCSRAILLRGGTIAADGQPDRVVASYLAAGSEAARQVVRFKPPAGVPAWMEEATLSFDGEPATSAPMGSNIVFSVAFESSVPMRHPRIGYVLQTLGGERLVNSNNRFQPAPTYGFAVTKGSITCDLGAPPLMPGKYSISLWFGDPFGDHHIVPEALSFEITERDLWGQGRLPETVTPMWWPTTYSLS